MTPTDSKPLSVALFATNDPRNYSGGRYLSLVMAYALAHAGCRVTVYTDHLPSFDADLSPLAPGKVRFVVTRDFVDGVQPEPLDWVLLIPTGIFLPAFYDAVTDYCAAAGARLALVNFESANWYNTASPNPRDARLWNSWRHSCLDGALVLSIAREGLQHARDFYQSPHADIRFDVWQPPINSPLAEQFDGSPRRKLVVGFVRPSDPHKGGRDLLALPPGLLADHELALVTGRDMDPDFLAAVQQHVAGTRGARVSVHTRISDAAKLQLLSEARLLLFPSYFEGYGYPPIEALYCGTPVVCYDLPVLRETVGEAAHFAKPGDNAGFAAAAAAALARATDPAALRRSVHRFAHFPTRAAALLDLLIRHGDAVPARRPPAFLSSVGPLAGTRPRAPGPQDLPPLPAFPFHLTDARTLADDQVAVTALVASVAPLTGAFASVDGVAVPAMLMPIDDDAVRGPASHVHLVLPPELTPEAEVCVTLIDAEGAVVEERFRLRSTIDARDEAAPCGAALTLQRVGEGLFVHGWVLAGQAVDRVALDAGGAEWVVADVGELRPDLAPLHPGRTDVRAGFTMQLPVADLPPAGADLLLLGGGRTLGLLRGWPHHASGAAVVRRGRSADAEPQTIELSDLLNDHWQHGVSLFGDAHTPSMFVTPDARADVLQAGARLRFASGTVAQVRLVHKKRDLWNVAVDRPLTPYLDGYPNPVQILADRRPPADDMLPFAPDPEGDAGWLNGVRIARDEGHRRAVRLRADAPAAAALEPGAMLHFEAAGACTVLAVEEHPDALVVWLDAPVGPVRDGAPLATRLTSLPQAGDLLLAPTPSAAQPHGVHADSGGRSRVWFASDGSADALAAGRVLRFAGAGMLAVEAVERGPEGIVATVAGTLDAAGDGAPHAVHLLDPATAPPRRQARWPVPAFEAPDPFHLQVAERCLPSRIAGPVAPAMADAGRPRVLFLTPVPPTPANQGNRVVTRNLIAHLIDLGYDVDCVVQGWVDVPGFIDAFGGRARLYHCASPTWQRSDEVRARISARDALGPTLTPMHDAMGRALDEFHPFFIVRDETVHRARTLLQARRYDSIVCNYLHMARVVKELEDEFALPRSCVITHDALSNLTRRLGRTMLDTSYRACTAATERDALNAVRDGVVVAISNEEQRYFSDIGVTQPIVLCEYDAAGELADHVVEPAAFHARCLLFSASRNPMNLAGLGWFLDECWPTVLDAVPDAQLVISGPICEALSDDLPNVTLAGNVERSALLALMQRASLAINPCVAGTGLKIKTVEAVCMGLPAICLPAAVDGLRQQADRFAIVADDAAGFSAGCITLLGDAARWTALHEGGLSVAGERFSHATVYRELDAVMGWTSRPAAPRAAAAADPLGVGATVRDHQLAADPAALFALRRTLPDDPSVLLALARELGDAGETTSAHQIAERAVAIAPTSTYHRNVAARLAIDAGAHWLAVLHAAHLVAGPNGVRPEGYALMGEALLALGRREAASQALLQALAIEPDDPAVASLLLEANLGHADHQLSAWAMRRVLPPLSLGDVCLTTAAEAGVAHLAQGWSRPEAWGTWTLDDQAVIELSLAEPVDGDLAVTLIGQGFAPFAHSRCTVTAQVGAHRLAQFDFSYGQPYCEHTVRCPGALLNDRRHLVLTLQIVKPVSPESLGLGPDPRRLGLGLHALRVDAWAAEPPVATATRAAAVAAP